MTAVTTFSTRTADPGSADTVTRAGVAVVVLPAEIDLESAGALRDELLATLNREGVHLVADAEQVTFMDPSGVNTLVRARQRAEQLGGSLHVVSTVPAVVRVLKITRLERRLGLVATMDEAMSCLARPDGLHSCSAGG